MGKISRVWRNFSWTLAGNAAVALSQWAIIVALTRFGSPETLGAYVLSASIAGSVFGLANLELRTVLVTDPMGRLLFGSYARLRLLTCFAAVLVLCILTLVAPYSRTARLAILAVALTKALDGMSDIVYARLQLAEQLSVAGQSQLLKAMLSVAAVAALVFAGDGLWVICSLAIPAALVFSFFDLRVLSRFCALEITRLSVCPGVMGRIACTGFPLAIVSALVLFHAAVPRLILARISESAAGVLGALSFLAISPNLIMVALGQSSVTSLVNSLRARRRMDYLRSVAGLAGAAVLTGMLSLVAGAVFGPRILSVFYGSRFSGYQTELLLLQAGATIGYLNTAIGYSLSSARVFAPQVLTMSIVCLSSLAASVILIPRWGIGGAALSQIVSYSAQLTANLILFSRLVKAHFPEGLVGPAAQSLALDPKL